MKNYLTPLLASFCFIALSLGCKVAAQTTQTIKEGQIAWVSHTATYYFLRENEEISTNT